MNCPDWCRLLFTKTLFMAASIPPLVLAEAMRLTLALACGQQPFANGVWCDWSSRETYAPWQRSGGDGIFPSASESGGILNCLAMCAGQTFTNDSGQHFPCLQSQRCDAFTETELNVFMLISVSLIPRLHLLSWKETDLMEKDLNSTCVARKWAFRLSFRSFPTSEKICLRNRPFLAPVNIRDKLSIQTHSSRDVRNRAPLNTAVCGIRRWIHYSWESNLMCADQGASSRANGWYSAQLTGVQMNHVLLLIYVNIY